RVAKWAVYAVLAFALANVFLAYFVGRARLEQWVFHSPADHPVGFAVVAVVTALMFFDFAYFREQMCIVTCPYGRLQSVLLDKQSLIVGYDAGRGEPRGKRRKLPVVTDGAPAPAQGDCVDCGACVAVCPTGIDIRNGLQMECVGCAQCIDACDPIMTQTGRPTGLIRYTSEDELAGVPRKLLRPRTLIYPALIALVVGLLGYASSHRTDADVWVERITGAPFVALADGHVAAAARISLENRAASPRVYTLTLVDAPDATLRAGTTLTLAPGQRVTLPMFVDVPAASFVDGKRHVTLRVADDAGGARDLVLPLLGPEAGGGA
ncbi:MAG: 4Fe-4S dicluster domain-containing protein, partial [Kofleriaceae bacterium]